MALQPKGRGRGFSQKLHEDVPLIHPPSDFCSVQVNKKHSFSPDRTIVLEEVGLKLQQPGIFQHAVAPRPDFGTMGRQINLITNVFKVMIPDGVIYHYDVEIQNKNQFQDFASHVSVNEKKRYRCIGTQKNRRIMEALIQSDGNLRGTYPAYDGRKNLFSRTPIKGAPLTKDVILGVADRTKEKCDTYTVTVRPVHKKESSDCAINLNTLHAFFNGSVSNAPHEAIMALETVMRSTPCLKMIPIGRSFFSAPSSNQRLPIGGGQEIWFGYHQSIRLGQWGPLINLDVSATTFYEKGPVIDHVCHVYNWRKEDILNKPCLTDFEIRCMTRELKTMKIETLHSVLKKVHTVIRITREPASKLQFEFTKDGKTAMIKVSDYFKLRYNKNLQYPHLPCVQVAPESKKIYLPIEVCIIAEAQHCRKYLSDEQKKEMIKFTAHPPKERFAKIEKIAEKANFNADSTCKEFDISVDRRPVIAQARVFDPPNISYNKNTFTKPRDGQWDMKEMKFLKSPVVKTWVLLSFAQPNHCPMDDLRKFARMLSGVCCERGLILDAPKAINIISDRRTKVERVLVNMKSEYAIELAVIVIPKFNKEIYIEVKQVSETLLGLITQCIKDDNVKRCNHSLLKNLSLKLNTKLGGINSILELSDRPPILKKPVIIIGADVTHPSPADKVKSSVAAVVGSIDAYAARYVVTCRAQAHRKPTKTGFEVMQELQSMVKDILMTFFNRTKGKKPEKIIFYRDGVSESQFEAIKDHEVQAIRQACKSLSADYQPGITFIVVQKRHHIRFAVQDPRDGVGKSRNVPPGTTIDTTITSPTSFDFYQCSHMSPLGTSRPAYYTVLADDNGFSADHLQKLTYHLCFTYARCTKSISIPAPIVYAHLAAFRARQWLILQVDDSTSDSSYGSLPEKVISGVKVMDDLSTSMYFV